MFVFVCFCYHKDLPHPPLWKRRHGRCNLAYAGGSCLVTFTKSSVGMPWHGMSCPAVACRGMPWHAMACHGMPWHALTCDNMIWHACHGMPWHDLKIGFTRLACHGMPCGKGDEGAWAPPGPPLPMMSMYFVLSKWPHIPNATPTRKESCCKTNSFWVGLELGAIRKFDQNKTESQH